MTRTVELLGLQDAMEKKAAWLAPLGRLVLPWVIEKGFDWLTTPNKENGHQTQPSYPYPNRPFYDPYPYRPVSQPSYPTPWQPGWNPFSPKSQPYSPQKQPDRNPFLPQPGRPPKWGDPWLIGIGPGYREPQGGNPFLPKSQPSFNPFQPTQPSTKTKSPEPIPIGPYKPWGSQSGLEKRRPWLGTGFENPNIGPYGPYRTGGVNLPTQQPSYPGHNPLNPAPRPYSPQRPYTPTGTKTPSQSNPWQRALKSYSDYINSSEYKRKMLMM